MSNITDTMVQEKISMPQVVLRKPSLQEYDNALLESNKGQFCNLIMECAQPSIGCITSPMFGYLYIYRVCKKHYKLTLQNKGNAW